MNPLTNQVKQNLQYYTLWTSVKVHEINCFQSNQPSDDKTEILSGYPPHKLSSVDENHLLEWVIPLVANSQAELSVKTINGWFKQILLLSGSRPKRVTVGLVNDDSTVVYYFIHDGLIKPVQN